MDRSVEANLEFVLRATGTSDQALIKIKIDEALRRVGLATKGFKMPYELSGGEQQRVVIARAIINDPEIIIADEPTGNLDPETSNDIMLLLRHLNEEFKTAVLMATHNYNIPEKWPPKPCAVSTGSCRWNYRKAFLHNNSYCLAVIRQGGMSPPADHLISELCFHACCTI